MKLRKCLCLFLVALFSLPTLGIKCFADEGMWPFNNVPKAEIKRRYGFDVTDDWLSRVRLSSVRFSSGASGSFVSPDGLVLTNQHVATPAVQKLSTPGHDYVKDGFYARTAEQEIKSPDLEVNVLESMENVTARV